MNIPNDLVEAAVKARDAAYAPYSSFRVGAAVLSRDGRIFAGCNVENLSFGLTSCAERNAIFGAVAAGAVRFEILVVIADTSEPVSPCGACRQVMAEFGDYRVVSTNLHERTFESTVGALLPRSRTGILDLE